MELSPFEKFRFRNFQIQLHDLTFTPEKNQVIYVESSYNEDVNRIIRENITRIERVYKNNGLEFVYLPYLNYVSDVKVRYHAPYLSHDIDETPQLDSGFLLDFMLHPEERNGIGASLLLYSHLDGDVAVFDGLRLGGKGILHLILAAARIETSGNSSCYEKSVKNDDADKSPSLVSRLKKWFGNSSEPDNDNRFGSVCEERKSDRKEIIHGISCDTWSTVDDEVKTNISHSAHDGAKTENLWPISVSKDDLDFNYAISASVGSSKPEAEEDITYLLDSLQKSVEKLQLKGITLAAIHKLIDKRKKVSRLLITDDFRIFLPDYNNIEIEMGSLPKALFFTFLNHPEGIVIKNISDYYNEIFNIYKQLKPNFKEENLRVSVTKLTNPVGNGINENIARIRFAFVRKFDESLAQNYFISGKKGETYGIPLDRNLVEWEEE